MQPKSSVLLRAIRREALSDDLFGAGIASGSSKIILQRSAECLAQILVRQEALPPVLRTMHAAQLRLIAEIVDKFAELGIAAPDALKAVIKDRDALPDVPSELDVRLHERGEDALADGLRVLREHESPADQAFIADISRRIMKLELELRREVNEQLDTLKRHENRTEASLPETAPPPTADRMTNYLRTRFPRHPDIRASNVQRLVGDNSKDIFFFDVSSAGELSGSYVMRREPACNVTLASVAIEYELMNCLHRAGLLVPRALLGEGDPTHFGGGVVVTEKLNGSPRRPADLGTGAADILRQVARLSAQIHTVEIPTHLVQYSNDERSMRERVLTTVRTYYERWKKERSENSVILEAAYNWLHSNVDCLGDEAVICHGDYNLRNILLDGDKVSAVLDWELTHIGHPAEDLAYIRADVQEVMAWEDYLAVYRRHVTHQITNAELYYFEVWVQFWRLAMSICIFSGYELNRHRNFIWASVACVEYQQVSDRMTHLLANAP
jgi:aminoglycoside phosphotransferase (APT) family kinase protein